MATGAFRGRRAAAMWAASLMLLAGCGILLAPFVQTVREHRPDPRSETTITTVSVCYNRATTTPEAVRGLAEDVCAKQGAQAVFSEHRVLRCFLLQPVSAIFMCRKDRDNAATSVGPTRK